MTFPTNKSVDVLPYQQGARDDFGNPVESWGGPVPTPVYGWGPRSADGAAEPNMPHRDAVIIGLTVYGPPATQIGARDRVVVAGVTYEVDGEIGDWNNGPFGWLPGVSIALKRVEG